MLRGDSRVQRLALAAARAAPDRRGRAGAAGRAGDRRRPAGRARPAALGVRAASRSWSGRRSWATFGYQPWETGHRIYPLRVLGDLRDGARELVRRRHAVRRRPLPADRRAGRAVVLRPDGRRWRGCCSTAASRLASVAAGFALFAIPSTALTSPDSGLRGGHVPRCWRWRPSPSASAQTARPRHRARPARGARGGDRRGRRWSWPPRPASPRAPCSTGATGTRWAADNNRVSVGYVWDQHYGPLKWPKKRTDRVRGASRRGRSTGRPASLTISRSTTGRRRPASWAGVQRRHRRSACRTESLPEPRRSTPGSPRRRRPGSRSRSRGWPTGTCCPPASRSATTSISPRGRHAVHRRHGPMASTTRPGRELHGARVRAGPDPEPAGRRR